MPTDPGNGARLVHAVTDDKWRVGLLAAPQKRRQIPRVVLTIAVHGAGPLESLIEREAKARLQRGTFAEIARMANYVRAGGLRESVGIIR